MQGGATNNTGRLEVCHANLWGTVCDANFGTPDATVACRQLGFNSTSKSMHMTEFGDKMSWRISYRVLYNKEFFFFLWGGGGGGEKHVV